MSNYFEVLEEKLWEKEEILFDLREIRSEVKQIILDDIHSKPASQRGFFFEDVACEFFKYIGFNVTQTKKTRDFGLDAIVKTTMEPLGELTLGLQAKWKKIDSRDVDLLKRALDLAEIRLGVVVCKESGRLTKHTTHAKLKAMLVQFGVEGESMSEVPKLPLEQVFILKFIDVVEIFSRKFRSKVEGVYKK